jgi:hypothetical protein
VLSGLTLVAAGCGGEQRDEVSFSGQQAEVAGVVADLQEAAEQDEVTRICRALVAESLAGSGCADRVQQAIDDSDQYALDVRSVRVSGDTATARVIVGTGDAERAATMRFVRQGSTWRISAFA